MTHFWVPVDRGVYTLGKCFTGSIIRSNSEIGWSQTMPPAVLHLMALVFCPSLILKYICSILVHQTFIQQPPNGHTYALQTSEHARAWVTRINKKGSREHDVWPHRKRFINDTTAALICACASMNGTFYTSMHIDASSVPSYGRTRSTHMDTHMTRMCACPTCFAWRRRIENVRQITYRFIEISYTYVCKMCRHHFDGYSPRLFHNFL